jgi:Skp family chaperone for outer membrane proteins
MLKGPIMKTRVAVVACVVCAVAGSLPSLIDRGSAADRAPQQPQGVAVVRVLEILREQAATGERRREIMAERSQATQELDQLTRQINEQDQALRTFTVGSDDYLKQLEKVMEMQGRYQSRKEFLDRQMSMKQQLWTQQAYDRIARVTTEVAKAKGFGLVMAADPNGLPLSETFSTMIAMQKVVYAGGCPDLTDEVKAKLAARP